MWLVLSTSATAISLLWLFAAAALRLRAYLDDKAVALAYEIWAELKYLALVSFLTAPYLSLLHRPQRNGIMWAAFGTVLNGAMWWLYRDEGDDDDRWKRRRRKLAQKIAEVGGKLAVVPSNA